MHCQMAQKKCVEEKQWALDCPHIIGVKRTNFQVLEMDWNPSNKELCDFNSDQWDWP